VQEEGTLLSHGGEAAECVRDILGDVVSKQKVNADEKEKSEEEEKKK
jgi:hypothetical protein